MKMKKVLAILLALAMVFALAACTKSEPKEEPAGTEETEEADAKGEGVMTYEEYVAADLESEVVVETYVQAKQGWWEDKATLYTQDKDGGYFLYNMPCSQEDYDKLVEGTKIKVTGYKAEWSGEIEIIDATFEILDGSYVAEPVDLTGELASADLINYQNQKFAAKGLTVAPSTDGDGNEVAFLYNWDGSGEPGSDLYFNVTLDGNTYLFTVESYLCGQDTDVYKAVEALEVGQTIDVEGFMYWYEGANPHITSVTVN